MQIPDFNQIRIESRFLKMAAVFTGLFLGTAAVLVFLMTGELTENLALSLLQNAEVRAYQLESTVEEIVLTGEREHLGALGANAQRLQTDLDVIYGRDASYLFCLVQADEGEVVFQDATVALPEAVFARVAFADSPRAQSPVVSEETLLIGDEERSFYLIAVPIIIQDRRLGALKLGISRRELTLEVESLVNFLIQRHLLGGILLVVIGALAAWQTVRLMREAHRMEAQAKETDRLVFLGTIAGGLAHEIRNPLNAISVDSELLAEVAQDMDADDRAEIAKLSLDISESVRYLNATLSSFLQFARPVALDRERVKPGTLVLETVRLIGRQCARQGILLEWESPADLPEIDVAVPQIKQALLNLLLNAQQAMPDGGVLAVHLHADSNGVQIDVSDTGDGIPKAEQERVFNLFYSTKSSGSGLGLALARRIVEMHGGRLFLKSQPNEGATFSMRLPLCGLEGSDDDS